MKCIVAGCKNIINHRFPKHSQEIFLKWVAAARKNATEIRKNDGFCFRHFRPEDFTHQPIEAAFVKIRRLTKVAVPSLYLAESHLAQEEVHDTQQNQIPGPVPEVNPSLATVPIYEPESTICPSLTEVSLDDRPPGSPLLFKNNRLHDVKPTIRVLSLFDNISTALVILRKLNLKIEVYYASEVDEDAIRISKKNFGRMVKNLGDIRNIGPKKLNEIGPIHLLLGGSPCNDLSMANHVQKGLLDKFGTGILFFHYVKIKNYVVKKSIENNTPFYWVFENVPMKLVYQERITRALKSEPYRLNSVHFSPQKRVRLYWTNLPWRPEEHTVNISLKDCLVKRVGRSTEFTKIYTITTKTNSLKQGKERNILPVWYNGTRSQLWMTEIERIFGFKPHYTDAGLEKTRRLQLLGKAWCVNTVFAILHPLREVFETLDQ